jgi:hypothetical protein
MLHRFTHNGLTFEIAIPDGQTPEQAQHEHLLRVDPGYQWLSFRRALIASPEYVLAVSLALQNPSIAVADGKLNSAIDFCCHGGVEPEEIAAFQSAIALYFAQLDVVGTAETEAIKNTLIEIAQDHLIAIPS